MNDVPIVRDTVLLGGGHSHVLCIKRWAMKPTVGIRLTLISRDVLTPYSGMLPGYIAGHYTSEEIHIDLSRLCAWAGVRFVRSEASGVAPADNSVLLKNRPAIEYDVLSINTGSTPDLASVPGAAKYVLPVKPIHHFQARWESLLQRIEKFTQADSISLAVVGSGVGGFELLLALGKSLSTSKTNLTLHWVLRGLEPIRTRPQKARRLALEACATRGIVVHFQFDVVKVLPDRLVARDGREIHCAEIVWCTAAAAPSWIEQSGLATDEKGFVATNACLQSLSHPNIFACGDVGTQLHSPSEKAGVFAVRQAPVIFTNLTNFLTGRRLRRYRPQKNILNLMALGEKSAIATRGNMTLAGARVWQWKDHIDRSFMRNFSRLKEPKMRHENVTDIPAVLLLDSGGVEYHSTDRCGGCGAKTPASVLDSVLSTLEPVAHDSVYIGLEQHDDCAVIDAGTPLIQSVDQISEMISDPWEFGRIAALHAMSDLHAMGAIAQSAQALVGLPFATETVQKRELTQLMSGATEELNRQGCALVGGHTGESSIKSLGFVVNGVLPGSDHQPRARPITSTAALLHSSLNAGDVLILTKPLGTGVLLAAHMRGSAHGLHVRACIDSMLQSNAAAAKVLSNCGVTACTDITGFGLMGHLSSMLTASSVGCSLKLHKVPVLDGARSLVADGFASTLLPSNKKFLSFVENLGSGPGNQAEISLACDPQTSGGLLAGLPSKNANACIRELVATGYVNSAIIGVCESGTPAIRLA